MQKNQVFKTLIILLNIILNTNQCQEGCIICDYPDCKLCDFQNHYFLKDKTCIQNYIEFCSILSIEGNCLQCMHDYLLDSNQCVNNQIEERIEYCEQHNTNLNCTQCQYGYFLQNNSCFQLNNIIQNCKIQSSDDQCLECFSGYYLLENQCKEKQMNQNCQIYSNKKCQKCNSDYVLEPNALKIHLIQQAYIQNYVDIFNLLKKDYIQGYQQCKQKTIKNCKEFETFDSCKICDSGYFLFDGICIKEPYEVIYNCFEQQNYTQCKKCQQGYHLTQDEICEQNQLIENCILYAQDSYKTECIKCEQNYYTQQNNCVLRSKVILNCYQYDLNQDTCQQCEQNYQLVLNQTKCIKQIPNCEYSILEGETQICKQCKDYFYLQNNNCLSGYIDNCLQYINQNKCKTCIQQYYLDNNGICIKHNIINGCENYHNYQKDTCLKCQQNQLIISKKNSCIKNTIQNCNIIDKNENCIQCQIGYNLISNNICQEIIQPSYCIKQIKGICIECKENYELKDGKCFEPNFFIYLNCQKSQIQNTNLKEDSYCEICDMQNFPYFFNQMFYCQDTQDVTLIENCLQYQQENDQLKCIKCSDQYFVSVQGTCVNKCQSNEQIRIGKYITNNFENQYINQNYCIPSIIQGCSIQSHFVLENNIITQKCVKCQTQYNQVLDNNTKLKSLNDDYKYSVHCIYNNTEQTKQSFCQYYHQFSNQELKCLQCNKNYTGIIQQYKQDYCLSYDDNTFQCVECLIGYNLVNGKCQNETQIDIINCQIYSFQEQLCYKCLKGFVLNQNQRQCNQIDQDINCEIYNQNNKQCIKCFKDFIFDSKLNQCVIEINYCEIYQNTNQCEKCITGFYANSNQDTCIQGQQSDCLIYQNFTGQCTKYKNQIDVNTTNKCQEIQKIQNCIKYDNNEQCLQCEQNYYLQNYNGKCCPVQYYGDNCEIQSENCLEIQLVQDNFECTKCQSNQYLHNKKCIKNFYYEYKEQQTNIIMVETNQINCIIFDYQTFQCQVCKDNYYLSSGQCCQNGFYQENDQCQIINQIQNCIQAQSQDNNHFECLKCQQEYQLIQNNCIKLISNCQYLDLNHMCLQCQENYYLTKNFCCAFNTYLDQDDKCQNLTEGNLKYCKKYEQKCLECTDGYVLIDFLCIEIQSMYKGCVQIEDNNLKCLKCEQNYQIQNGICCNSKNQIFNSVEGKCIDLIKKTCQQGYYMTYDNTCCQNGEIYVNNECIDFEDLTANCLIFDKNNLQCLFCQSTDYFLSQNKCVPQGYYLNNNILLANNIDNCLQQNVNECLLCQNDYYLKDGLCLIYPNNCLRIKFDNQQQDYFCDQCATQYVYNTQNQLCEKVEITSPQLQNCQKQSNQQCIQCQNGYYTSNNYCCQYGKYYNGNYCQQIPINNCSMFIDNKCQECFLQNNISQNQIIYEYKFFNDFIFQKVHFNTNPNSQFYYQNYILQQGSCCPMGQTFDINQQKCILNSINNCLIQEDQKCLSCQDDYFLSNDNLNCCNNNQIYQNGECIDQQNKTCAQGFYLSNNHCCKEKYYWSTELQKCKPLIDQYCLKSNQLQSCDICIENHYPSPVNNVIIIDYLNDTQFYGKFCQKINILDSIYQYGINNLKNECQIPNIQDEICDVCNQQSYQLDQNHMCCPNGQFLYNIKEQSQCVEISKLSQNCLNFNLQEMVCQECIQNYHLDQNICCPLNYFYNFKTKQCDIFISNCQVYNSFNKQCEICQENHYLHLQNCCGYNEYFDIQEQICKLSLDCYKYEQNSNICQNCKKGYYLNNKKCCQFGYYFNGNNCIQDLQNNINNGSTGCLIYGEQLECLQCEFDLLLTNGKCCPQQQFYDGQQCQQYPLNCLKINQENNCILCENGLLPVQNICCGLNQFYSEQTKQCESIYFYDQCLNFDEDGCFQCLPNTIPIWNTNINYFNCQTFEFQIIDNCLRYQQSGKCKQCKPLYTLSFNGLQCIQLKEDRCQRYDYQYECRECIQGDILFEGECIQPIRNCLIFESDQKVDCLRCENYYYRDLYDFQCYNFSNVNIDQKIPNCIFAHYFLENQQEKIICEQCEQDYYLQNNKCILANKVQECIQYNNQNKCNRCNEDYYILQEIDGFNTCCYKNQFDFNQQCQSDRDFTIQNCDFYKSTFIENILQIQCQKCKDQFYLFEQTCCPIGTYLKDNECVNSTIDSLKNCLYFLDEDNCDQSYTQPCQSGYYLHNQNCCKEGFYYNLQNQQCQQIDILNCAQIDNQQNCIQCIENTTLYNNSCCLSTQFFDYQTQQCMYKGINCLENDQYDGNCLKCIQSDYYIQKNNCCPLGQYYNDIQNQCTQISQIKNCEKGNQFNDYFTCNKCQDNYTLFNNQFCCPIGTVLIQDQCLDMQFLQNCLQLNINGLCQKCIDNFYLSSEYSICCQENQYYNIQNQICENIQIQNCTQSNNNSECQKCKEGFYLTNQNKNCCLIGQYWNGQICENTDIDNCLEFDKINNVLICQKCQAGFNLYQRQDVSSICCQDKYYYNHLINIHQCIPFDYNIENCLQLNQDRPLCEKCQGYLSDHYCCSEFQFFETNQCKIILQDNCLQYSNLNQSCLKCENEFYLTNKNCCLEGYYYNFQNKQCEQIQNIAIQQNCLQLSNQVCLKCKQNYHLFKNQCYEYGQHLDQNIQFYSSLDNCMEIFQDGQQILCNYCKYGYYLSENKQSCCLENQLLQNNDCVDQALIPQNCIIWNPLNFQCELCNEQLSFLYKGTCIEYGFYIDQNNQIQQINQQNCIQWNNIANQCIKCKDNYYLDNTNLCQQMPLDCIQYDLENDKCNQCKEGFYLSNLICCPEGQYNKENQCIEIDQNKNCNKQVNQTCIECIENFYIQNGKCCQEGYYYSQQNQQCQLSEVINCLKFDLEGQCQQCKENYIIIKNNQNSQMCLKIPIQNCKMASFTEQLNTLQCIECQNQNYLLKDELQSIKYIFDQVPNNCEYVEIVQDLQNSSFKCIKCNQNTQYFVNQDGICIIRNNTTGCIIQDNNFIKDFDGCKSCIEGFYLKDGQCLEILQENCIKINKDLCTQCKQDYQLLWQQKEQQLVSYCYKNYINQNSYKNNPSYIEQCQEQYSQCTGQIYSNISQELYLLYNCQICQDNYIPITNGSFKDNNIILAESQNNNKSSNCIEIQNINTIKNCAFVLNYFNNDQNMNSIACLACKPGYKAIMLTGSNNIVTECEQIQNCKSPGSIINGCKECEQGYAQKSFQNQVDYTKCIKTEQNMLNCKILDINNKCILCDDGYFLTENQDCIIIEIEQCQGVFQNTQINDFYLKDFTQNTYSGCSKCQDSQIQILQNYSNYICLNTSDLTQETNCLQFGIENKQQTCKQCKEQYIFSKGIQCIYQTQNLINCDIAESSEKCIKCKQNYIVIKGQCEQKNIENCQIYDENIQDKQICLQCNDYYYLENNICNKGKISNCLVYQQQQCVQCQNKHVLIKGQNGFQQCLKIQLQDYCLKYTQNDLYQNTSCYQCQEDYHISEIDSQYNSSCENFNDIPFCIEYEDDIHLPNSHFNCNLCDFDHYLEDNWCKQRSGNYENCSIFAQKQDNCKVCNEGYFYSIVDLQCVKNNSGIQNCQKYKSKQECIQCKNLYYLYNNQCIHVQQQNIVENCMKYDQEQNCQECLEFYNLQGNKCIQNTIDFCKLQQNDICLKCDQNYLINSQQKCQKIEIIQNCKIQNEFLQKQCIQCDDNYYPFEDQCLPVINKIENCEAYKQDMLCQKCFYGYYLNLKGQCVNNVEELQCDDLQETENQCILCKSGFRLTLQNICVEDIDGSQMPGCFLGDNKDPGICLICESNYYHDKNKVCQKYDTITIRAQNNSLNVDSFSFIVLMQSFLLILSLIQLIFVLQFLYQFFNLFIFLF